MKRIETYESIVFIPIQMLCNDVLSFRKQKFWVFEKLLSLLKPLYKKKMLRNIS